MRFGLTIATLTAAVAFSALPAPAYAQSGVCNRLEARLASLSSGGSSAQSKRYDRAIARQKTQIGKIRAQMRSGRCSTGSFILFGSRNSPQCDQLNGLLKKMESNLRSLTSQRNAGSNRNSRERRRIENALDKNNCRGSRDTLAGVGLFGNLGGNNRKTLSVRRSGITEIIGDGEPRDRAARRRVNLDPRSSSSPVAPTLSYGLRTMCVRTCDGFYFPITSVASPSDFDRDEEACSLMCPGTETRLYAHSLTGEETEDMTSIRTGEAYRDLPTAFAYRGNDGPESPSCSCNMTAFYREIQRREGIIEQRRNGTQKAVTTWVVPTPRPDPDEDPETIANTGDGISVAELRLLTSPETRQGGDIAPAERQVRIVGPAFLPDDTDTIDLRNPLPDRIID